MHGERGRRYERSIFLNCPFDAAYRPMFEALVFAIHDCGFEARCALEAEDGGEERIRKIKRIIRECRFGVHDISRVQLDPTNRLPRFNMPLELGLFLGAQEYGPRSQRKKRSLVLDSEPYRYQKFCSDIAGQDVRPHHDSLQRRWLRYGRCSRPRWTVMLGFPARPRYTPGTPAFAPIYPASAGSCT